MNTESNKNLKRVWILLAIPPILFFVLIVISSLYFGFVSRGDAAAIAESVPRSMPIILLLAQIILLFVLIFTLRKENLTFADIGWRLQTGQSFQVEMLLGSIIGVGLGLLYPPVFSPLVETLQKSVGDYVPPGEIVPALGSYIVPFFIANVLLAPFVEENIYRGYAITKLRQRYGQGLTLLTTCVFFGLLHWAGGIWYMVLTGGFLGVILAGLFMWRKNIIVPFTLHLALNIVEFIFILQNT